MEDSSITQRVGDIRMWREGGALVCGARRDERSTYELVIVQAGSLPNTVGHFFVTILISGTETLPML